MTSELAHVYDVATNRALQILDLQQEVVRLKTALITLANLEGIVFAADDKERPMLAQSVVREIAQRALGDEKR